MTKKISMLFAAFVVALVSQLALLTEASAQRRCGDFIRNGTIYVSSRARDCDRGTAWQRDARGHRYWGPRHAAPRQPAYYYSPPTVRRQREIVQTRSYAPVPVYRPAVAATNYIPGAPRNAAECYARGGTLANGGRGCTGYR